MHSKRRRGFAVNSRSAIKNRKEKIFGRHIKQYLSAIRCFRFTSPLFCLRLSSEADMSVDVEKQEPPPMTTADNSSAKLEQHEDDHGNDGLLTTSLSQSTQQSTESLGRTRSQNGYGVDETQTAASARADASEKDPFEVGWDNGASDPLCPWSFSKARKWMITSILCAGSFTV